MSLALPLLQRNFHPTVIVQGYSKALVKALEVLNNISREVDINDRAQLKELVMSAIGTKFSSRWGEMMVNMAITAVLKVVTRRGDYTEVDVKRYVRIEKIPGGELSDCMVLDGVMFNKDVTHSKMRRRIENPRILLLDCPLEYKKGESQTNVEITNEDDFNALLKQEEEYIEQICAQVSYQPIMSSYLYVSPGHHNNCTTFRLWPAGLMSSSPRRVYLTSLSTTCLRPGSQRSADCERLITIE